MSSLNTNASAMTALQTLALTNKNLAIVQNRISTGYRVSEAKDNAAYWSIATTMRSDNAALATVKDALGVGASKVDTAYAGMEQAIEYVKEIKNKLITAQEPAADRAKLQEDIAQLQEQLRGIAVSATYSGENWLQADLSSGGQTRSVVASFIRSASGSVSVEKLNYQLDSSSALFDTRAAGAKQGILDKTTTVEGNSITLQINVAGVLQDVTVEAFTTTEVINSGATTFNGSHATDGTANYVRVAHDTWVRAIDQSTVPTQEVAYDDGTTAWAVDTSAPVPTVTASIDTISITSATTMGQLDGLLKMVDTALSTLTSAAAKLGSVSSRIEMQDSFISKLMDSVERGIGQLVDADMEEESARLSALQVQQQLGIQALSIANSNAQNILTLFKG